MGWQRTAPSSSSMAPGSEGPEGRPRTPSNQWRMTSISFLSRSRSRDPPSSPQVGQAQSAALRAWYDDGPGRYDELKRIVQPTLVVHGHRDIMLPTMNACNLSQHIPNAQLIIYPRSGHGALFQYPTLFVQHTQLFLDG